MTQPQYRTFQETEAILKSAIKLPGRKIKEIADEIGINPNVFYKWKTSNAHLSPQKADALLLFFLKNEPDRLRIAEFLYYKTINNE